MKRRDVIEFEVDKMEFGGTSVSRYGNRDIHMKGGITAVSYTHLDVYKRQL